MALEKLMRDLEQETTCPDTCFKNITQTALWNIDWKTVILNSGKKFLEIKLKKKKRGEINQARKDGDMA